MDAQLPLPFALRAEYSFDTFVPGPNSAQIARLEALCTGNAAAGQTVWLIAAVGEGKTHLLQAMVAGADAVAGRVAYLPAARIAVAEAAALLEGLGGCALVCIDDLPAWLGDATLEQALVRLYQELRAAGGHLVLAAAAPAAGCEFALPDWESRCRGADVLTLASLTDADKRAVLEARARRLGLELDARAGDYLLRHARRGLPELLAVLDTADRKALAQQRRLTVPLLRSVLKS